MIPKINQVKKNTLLFFASEVQHHSRRFKHGNIILRLVTLVQNASYAPIEIQNIYGQEP